jgi:2-hydroxychromene-2-carboxylate isomerase
MKLEAKLRSLALTVLFSERCTTIRRRIAEIRRKISGQSHVVSVFLELDDPYSYLLAHYLPELASNFDIDLRLYLTEALTGALRPAPELYPEYAASDCRRLARELGVPFLDKGSAPPVEHRLALLNTLSACAAGQDSDRDLLGAISAYWRGDTEAVARFAVGATSSRVPAVLGDNQRLLQKLGHYNSAMLHYAGEWYWGVDRLHYLVARLRTLGAERSDDVPPGIASITQLMAVDLPVKPPAAAKKLPPLEYFHSFRSPYSYLALQRAMDIADAFGIEFRVRAVLPMVMRGMQVPREKLLYIAADSSREARRLGIPYGKMADPVGIGAERCLAVLRFAIAERRERDFLLNAGAAIWSQAVDISTDAGLRKVTGKSGLFWPGVKAALADEDWRTDAEDNRAAMMESGSWGVPTMRVGDYVTWGQDRDWLLIRHLEELCDSGDGILI